MDIKSPEARSQNMAAIKNKNTKPETMLRKALFKRGLRYRINCKITGKPDIVFLSKKIAIFVDGCFWHCCPQCYKEPEQNNEFWQKKLASNRERDQKVNKILTGDGWIVLRFWEHEIKKDLDTVCNVVVDHIK